MKGTEMASNLRMGRLRPAFVGLAMLVAALVLTACGSDTSGGSDSSGSSATPAGTTAASASRPEADAAKIAPIGPDGKEGVLASTMTLSPDEIAKLKQKANGKKFRVATFWQVQADTGTLQLRGMRDTFAKLGLPIEIVAEAYANWDAAKQSDQIQTLIKTKPDALVGILVDTAAASKAIQAANAANIPVVFWDVPADNAKYAAVISAHGRLAGWKAADALAEAIGGKGEVAALPMKFKFFPTDQRVDGFLERIKTYPDIKVVGQGQGATVFDDGQKVGEALLQRFPDIKGMFVSWQDPALGVVAAARTLGRTDLAVTTVDLAEKPALEIATCGILKGTVADYPYDLGVAEATAVAKIILGEKVPKFSVTDVNLANHATVLDLYKKVYRQDPPQKLQDAYKQSC
jgi:ribose transport system substrate-binding protein